MKQLIGQQALRWSRNSTCAALTLLGIAALYVGPDTEAAKVVITAAIATFALATLDLKGKAIDDALCRLAPLALAAIASWFGVFSEAGEDWRQVILLLSWALSIVLSVLAIHLMVAVLWQCIKGP